MPVHRTRNFGDASPGWVEVAAGISDSPLLGMALDPFGPRDRAYVLSEQGVWRTTGLDSATPGWGQVLNIANKIGVNYDPTLQKMQATIAQQNRLYVVGWRKITPTSPSEQQFIVRTDDGGSTWSVAYPTGGTTSEPGWFSLGEFGATVLDSFNAVDVANFVRTSSNCIDFCRLSGDGWIIIDLGAVYNMNNAGAYGDESGLNAFTYIDSGPTATGPWTEQFGGAKPHAGCSVFNSWGAPITEFSSRYLRYRAQGFALGNYRDYYEMDLYVSSGGAPLPLMPLSSLAVGQHNADKVYAGDGAVVRRSTNAGATWSTYIALATHDMECHYASNPSDDNLRIIGADGKFYTTVGATPTERSGWGVEVTSSATGRIVTFVGDANLIYTLFHDGSDSYSVKRSTDGGVNWDTRSSGHPNARAIGLWPYGAGDVVFMVTDNGPVYSSDGGANFSDKLGDLAGWADGNYIVPVWL